MIWRSSALTPDVAAAAVPAGGNTSVTPGVGSVVFTGFAPTVAAGLTLLPGAGSVVFTGFAPSVTGVGGVTLTPGAGSVIFTGFAPNVDGLAADATATTGSGDDTRRQKWLEWGRKKAQDRKQKGRKPEVQVVPRETHPEPEAPTQEPIQIVSTAPRAALLAANVAAIRAQQERERAIVEAVAGLRDLAAEAMAQDEEEAELLLLHGP